MSVVSIMEPLPDAAQRGPQEQAALDEERPVSTLEALAASFREAKDRVPLVQDLRISHGYTPLFLAVSELTGKSPYWSYISPLQVANPFDHDARDYDALWRDIAALTPEQRARLGVTTREAFENGLLTRGGESARDSRIAARGGLFSRLAGGAAAQVFDPVNVGIGLATGGASAGTSVARGVLIEGVVNAAAEAIETPLTLQAQRRMGDDPGAGDVAFNIAAAAAFGAGFHAAGRGLKAGVPRLVDQMAPGYRINRLIEKSNIGGVQVEALASTYADAVPPHMRSFEEQAALHVLTREEEIDASNPFDRSHAGIEAHRTRLEEGLRRLIDPVALQGAAQAASPRAVASPGLAGGGGPAPDFERAWGAIIGIEGGTDRSGRFRTSPAGAIGPAQVMPGTAPEAARLAGLAFDDRRYRTDAAYNDALGRAYYREMLRQFDGDPVKAAAAYNAGPGSAKSGRGVRGAMARAERAGVPGDWVSFLPAETRKYVANFRKRTGMAPGAAIEGGGAAAGGEDALSRSLDMEASDLEIERLRLDAEDSRRRGLGDAELPLLRRDQFDSDASWRVAQASADAERLGIEPAVTRRTIWDEARDRLMQDKAGEVRGALWHRDVGPIDVKWGNDSAGLAKIIQKHGEVLDNLPDLIAAMGVKEAGRNRIVLQSLDHKAVVRLDYDGEAQQWLLSAYQVKGKTPPPADYRGAGGDAGARARDRSPIAGVTDDIAADARALQEARLAQVRGERQRLDALHRSRLAVGRDFAGGDGAGTAYAREAQALGLEPMTGGEIAARHAELDAMEARAMEAPSDADVAAYREAQALGTGYPPMRDKAVARFDDPAAADAQAQADFIAHDLEAMAKAGELDGVNFATVAEGLEESAADVMARMDADAAALEALRGCL